MTGHTGKHPGPTATSPIGPGEAAHSISFSVRFLQEICDSIASELPGVIVSFMDARGCISASSARERIGDLHEGAARVMRGEMEKFEVNAEMAARSATMREGVSQPIVFEGRRVACLALAAPLSVAHSYANIVRKWVLSDLRAKREEQKS